MAESHGETWVRVLSEAVFHHCPGFPRYLDVIAEVRMPTVDLPEPELVSILVDDLDRHPAVIAWRQIDRGHVIPQAIEVIQLRKKSAVFRLTPALTNGAAVIAKRCETNTARLEWTIGTGIIPTLPISALRYYGYLETGDERAWIFSEDAGRQRFWPQEESHRILAAQWLGALHGSASQTTKADILPPRGPAFYLELLRSGRENISRHLSHPKWTAENIRLLSRVAMQLDQLEAQWHVLRASCDAFPCTLVHGDFRPKNAHVRLTDGRLALYALDWETAGWGIPGVDLAPSRGSSPEAHVVLSTYIEAVHPYWPNVDLTMLQQLVHVGYLFRRVAAIYWSSLDLDHKFIEKPMVSLQVFEEELGRSMQYLFREEPSVQPSTESRPLANVDAGRPTRFDSSDRDP